MAQKLTKMTEKDRVKNQPYDIDVIPPDAELTRTTKVLNKLTIVALVVIAIGLAVFLNWSFENDQPLVVKNSPFPTRSIPPEASANDVLILDIDYCKHTEKQGQVRASYVSETREIFMPVRTEQYDNGCFREDIPVIIPDDLPEDDYILKFVATYNLNPLKSNVKVEFESQPFHINKDGGRSETVE